MIQRFSVYVKKFHVRRCLIGMLCAVYVRVCIHSSSSKIIFAVVVILVVVVVVVEVAVVEVVAAAVVVVVVAAAAAADLLSDLKSELSGKFESFVLALFEHPRIYDAKECNGAISGVGTNEDTLIEILATRSNQEIKDIRDQYRLHYKRELERDIQADTSGDFKRLLTSLVTGNREERSQPDVELAKKEAMELYKAGEKRLGTDEAVFNRILCLRSNPQLCETFNQYKAISGKDIEKSIESEMSGNLEIGCLAIGEWTL
ncbi:annexin [Elysia marginata]|uniref:Annexin n=1 Tax=Elysia marginata TaxID=1093978 RepID=A0AAV4FW41_9GAST|nr:annexin [Elysia marginata]